MGVQHSLFKLCIKLGLVNAFRGGSFEWVCRAGGLVIYVVARIAFRDDRSLSGGAGLLQVQ